MSCNVKNCGRVKKYNDRNFKRMKSDVYYHGLRKQDKYKSWKNYSD